jgi:pyruvate dehydrogenase E1 component
MPSDKELTENWDSIETREWLESLDYVLQNGGPERARELIKDIQIHAYNAGVRFPFTSTTPYQNTIPKGEEVEYPGDEELERRLTSIIRWNAMAMVVRAQRGNTNVGGHISSYASSAYLYEVGFNHFFRGKNGDFPGDLVYFQGHTSPGIYSRAFLEGRLDQDQLKNFRRELAPEGGLSSYPHPRLMRDFWQFPTVSMGLGPIMALYHARFIKYMENRGLKPKTGEKIWCFIGDGETDEPETLGAINMASREKLDNLIFVINCNLQRLDGPVRGNGKIIQELEGIFRGAGWNVLKVIWGSNWDSLFENDSEGELLKAMLEAVDGDFQKYSTSDGAYVREHFFKNPKLKKLVEHLSDKDLKELKRGGHDLRKVYNAYKRATESNGSPTVVLAKTIKGYGLGESGEGKNVTHNQKKLNEQELREFRARFNIPISDAEIDKIPFYKPAPDSPEMKYMEERRQALGGALPARIVDFPKLKTPDESLFEEFYKGSGGREASTTMAFHRILAKLLKDKELGKYIVPIIPDEARTFGMEGLFRQVGIFSQVGQLYEPVDKDSLLYYKESNDGQILEEGINEAGAMSSFCVAGTAYANFGVPMIPFYIYYSMFGFQRIGDLVWAAGDLLCKGFLLGGTAGRTSLNGEGLQHQDGHSHVLFGTVPNALCYDPAFGFEVAVIIREGIRRMYEMDEKVFYYITVGTDAYDMPEMPENTKKLKEGILKGLYKFKKAKATKGNQKAHLFGSGAIMNSVLEAQEILKKYKVDADVWSVTSYNELRRDGVECDRWNMLNPGKKPKVPYVTEILSKEKGVVVSSSDYMKLQPDSIRKWVPQKMVNLGTDGYGMSETRENLRDYFEVDAKFVALATLTALQEEGKVKADVIKKAIKDLKIDTSKTDPMSLN